MTYMPPASPVNLDASITSLSAGSLTTVARADHVHTVSKVPVLIASSTLSSSAASVTISNIPASYVTLQLYANMNLAGATLAEWCGVQFNGDTGANYSDMQAGNNASWLSIPACGTTNYVANVDGITFINMLNYADTSRKKACIGQALYFYGATSSYTLGVPTVGGYWRNNNAITSITIFHGTYNIGAGSKFRLYGIS